MSNNAEYSTIQAPTNCYNHAAFVNKLDGITATFSWYAGDSSMRNREGTAGGRYYNGNVSSPG